MSDASDANTSPDSSARGRGSADARVTPDLAERRATLARVVELAPVPTYQVLEEEYVSLGLLTPPHAAAVAEARRELVDARERLECRREALLKARGATAAVVTAELRGDEDRLQAAEARHLRELHEHVLANPQSAERPPAALCLSGGGIRSATFALGVLQSLARAGLLGRFHYLSTVSGGGYIGSWLSAWIRQEPRGLDAVIERLKAPQGDAPEPSPIRHLREYSNYLSPRLSLLSADSWMLVATYLRNLALNWLVLVSLLAAVLVVPRYCAQIVVILHGSPSWLRFVWAGALMLLAVPVLAWAVAYMGRHAPSLRGQFAYSEPNTEWRFLGQCLLPLLVATTLLCCAWPPLRLIVTEPPEWVGGYGWLWAPAWAAAFILFSFTWIVLAWALNARLRERQAARRRQEIRAKLGAGAVGALLFFLLFTRDWLDPGHYPLLFVCLGLPVFLGSFLAGSMLFRAFTVRVADDQDREWAARAGGWVILAAAAWAAVSTLALFGPSWLMRLYDWSKVAAGAAGVTGVVSGVVTAVLGRSAKTPAAAASDRSAGASVVGALSRYGLVVAATVFVVFLAVVVSLFTSWLTTKLYGQDALAYRPAPPVVVLPPVVNAFVPSTVPPPTPARPDWHRRVVTRAAAWTSAALFLAFIGVGFAMSHFVSVNKFSLHAVYRNRLVRAYLGASRPGRDYSPTLNPFTGFDEDDNVRLHELAVDLNVVDAAALARAMCGGTAGTFGRFLLGQMPRTAELLAGWNADATSPAPPPPTFEAVARRELLTLAKLPDLHRRPMFVALRRAGDPDAARLGVAELARYQAELLSRGLSGAVAVRNGTTRLFHVVNIALNLVSGGKLAWQQRKAESFTASPLHCGSAELGYRPSEWYGGGVQPTTTGEPERLTPENAISLGTAMAISGAAASPNMGYHSSVPVAALLTLFNVRLGAWLGNPGRPGGRGNRPTFGLAHPNVSVRPLLEEAFGLTDDTRPYVYLSDGGHFDNLGLYEMVRRRCRVIIVCDAGADPTCAFDDLGSALRKIYIDQGVRVEFDGRIPIYPRSAKDKYKDLAAGQGYHAVATIDYAGRGATAEERERVNGVLVYVKAAFYGTGEPAHVYNYAQTCTDFPHESTADQFFSESQFESYRALGEYIGKAVAGEVEAAFRGCAWAPTTEGWVGPQPCRAAGTVPTPWVSFPIAEVPRVPSSSDGNGSV